jgi:DNA-binding protein YbaB
MAAEDRMTAQDSYQGFIDTALRNARGSEATGHRRIAAAAGQLQQALRAMAEGTVTGTDDAGYVEATIRLGGELVGMHISAYAMRDLSADALGPVCAAAIAAARQRAGEVMAQRMEEMVGAALDTPVEELIPPAYRQLPEIAELLEVRRS